MWSCPGNMPKYYPGPRDILPDPTRVIHVCLSDLGNILAYYLFRTTLLYKGIFNMYYVFEKGCAH